MLGDAAGKSTRECRAARNGWKCRTRAGDLALLSKRLQKVTETVDTALRNLRQVAQELRPPLLDAVGLPAALEVYLTELEASTGLSTTLHVQPLPILDAEQAISAFRICQEALTNILRHAQATEVATTVEAKADGVTIGIEDNGRGFSPEQASRKGSLGLLGMQERAALVNGSLKIESQPCRGTLVEFWMPTRRESRAGH